MNRARIWFQLCRLHTPAPIGLLLWPTLWALWFASIGKPSWLALSVFCCGGIGMRTVGCIINDLADYDIDRQVARTKTRPLARGLIKHKYVILAIVLLLSLLAMLLHVLNRPTQILAVIGVLLSVLYPLSKRFISCPQLILGLCFAWGVPMAYAYHNQLSDSRGWFLYGLVALWVVAYDTVYALQDKHDDKKINIGSMALWLGDRVNAVVAGAYAIFWLGCGLLGYLYARPWVYYFMWLAAGSLLRHQIVMLNKNTEDYAKLFRMNQWVGFIQWLGIILSYL